MAPTISIELSPNGDVKGKIQGFSGIDADWRTWSFTTAQMLSKHVNRPWLIDGPVVFAATHSSLIGVDEDVWNRTQNVMYAQFLALLPDVPNCQIARSLAERGNFTSLWKQLRQAYEGSGDELIQHLLTQVKAIKLEGKHALASFLSHFVPLVDNLKDLDEPTYTDSWAFRQLRKKIPGSVINSDVLNVSAELKTYRDLLAYLQKTLNTYNLEQKKNSLPPGAVGLNALADPPPQDSQASPQDSQASQALDSSVRSLIHAAQVYQNSNQASNSGCWFCKRPGHIASQCFHNPESRNYRGGFGRGGRGRFGPRSNFRGRSQANQANFARVVCTYCEVPGHTADRCWVALRKTSRVMSLLLFIRVAFPKLLLLILLMLVMMTVGIPVSKDSRIRIISSVLLLRKSPLGSATTTVTRNDYDIENQNNTLKIPCALKI